MVNVCMLIHTNKYPTFHEFWYIYFYTKLGSPDPSSPDMNYELGKSLGKIIILLDDDKAGSEAVVRLCQKIIPLGLTYPGTNTLTYVYNCMYMSVYVCVYTCICEIEGCSEDVPKNHIFRTDISRLAYLYEYYVYS